MNLESCSYQGQDLFVLEVLGELRGGFFLDSGASNGIRGSNTRLLEDAYDWRGICVEPNAKLFQELVANRRCVCVQCCLYDRDGEVDFLEAAGVYGGIVSEYEPDHLEFALSITGKQSASERLPVTRRTARTVRSLLHQASAPPIIDYWSLDTEGAELAILRAFPFDEYRFRVLTVEHNEGASREPIRQFLESRGYIRIGTLGIDDGYVWGDQVRSRAWRSNAWPSRRRR